MKTIAFFDTEIIGKFKPKFLIDVKINGKHQKFWLHKKGHLDKFEKLLLSDKYTWVGFNSENFDRPVIAAALMGYQEDALKILAEAIINDEMRSWQTYKEYDIDFVAYDHIDLYDVAPGVKLSLKIYAARMARKNLMDMPFHHDHDLTPAEEKIVEKYCETDVDVTEQLYNELLGEISMRLELGETYDIDLRSKSDAQCAEAILKRVCGIANKDKNVPSSVKYSTPTFIKTTNKSIKEIIERVNDTQFKINFANGEVIAPDFLNEPLRINNGYYQMGVGGLHSTHDKELYLEESEDLLQSDFDVASYYPNIMMKAGLIPRLGGNKGKLFLETYITIYNQRMEAKRSGNKRLANSLKILLNGTFGKLGSIYCSFYSPDLMLATTLTGQLNLLCLIHDLEKTKGVRVHSANTDGILVAYPPSARDTVLKAIQANAKRTGFEYEETPYSKYAAKDVNNYIAIKTAREAAVITAKGVELSMSKAGHKCKGLYGESGLKTDASPTGKNPTMEVCSKLAVDYLTTGIMDISKYTDMKDFVEVRNVKGGGVQPDKYVEVDDWVLTKDLDSAKSEWMRQKWLDNPENERVPVKRKSRPKPVEEGFGGTPFGRVARWYMTTKSMPALHYVLSGNKVPSTEGGRLCLTLPNSLPKDIDLNWYVTEAKRILTDCGVKL